MQRALGMDGVTESTDLPPPTLDTLPIEVVQQILSVAASTTTADALSLTNSGLCRTVSNATADVLLPVFSLPQREIGMCCPAAVVALDGDTLRKTARLGHAMVVFAERLGQRDAILELEILELPAWGALQVGILTSGADGKIGSLGSSVGWCRRWFDGVGRVHERDGERDGVEKVSMCGERAQVGDKLGVCYFASTNEVGFALNGALMGPALPLPLPPRNEDRRLHFFARFDCVEGTVARVVSERTAPIDRATIRASADAYVPRTPPGPTTLLARTVGPDSRCLEIPIETSYDECTVADLQKGVLYAIGADEWHEVELRVPDETRVSGTRLINGYAADASWKGRKLAEVGIGFEPRTGCQERDVLVSVPHLIS